MVLRKRKSRTSGDFPEMGAIFMSNRATKKECFRRNLLGLPSNFASFVEHVKAGMLLFLFEYETRSLYGVYQACSDGKMDIFPDAYNSSGRRYPAQVLFRTLWYCTPLPEKEFSSAIRDNYFAPNKFNFGLSRNQVQNLLRLFASRIKRDEIISWNFLSGGAKSFCMQNVNSSENKDAVTCAVDNKHAPRIIHQSLFFEDKVTCNAEEEYVPHYVLDSSLFSDNSRILISSEKAVQCSYLCDGTKDYRNEIIADRCSDLANHVVNLSNQLDSDDGDGKNILVEKYEPTILYPTADEEGDIKPNLNHVLSCIPSQSVNSNIKPLRIPRKLASGQTYVGPVCAAMNMSEKFLETHFAEGQCRETYNVEPTSSNVANCDSVLDPNSESYAKKYVGKESLYQDCMSPYLDNGFQKGSVFSRLKPACGTTAMIAGHVDESNDETNSAAIVDEVMNILDEHYHQLIREKKLSSAADVNDAVIYNSMEIENQVPTLQGTQHIELLPINFNIWATDHASGFVDSKEVPCVDFKRRSEMRKVHKKANVQGSEKSLIVVSSDRQRKRRKLVRPYLSHKDLLQTDSSRPESSTDASHSQLPSNDEASSIELPLTWDKDRAGPPPAADVMVGDSDGCTQTSSLNNDNYGNADAAIGAGENLLKAAGCSDSSACAKELLPGRDADAVTAGGSETLYLEANSLEKTSGNQSKDGCIDSGEDFIALSVENSDGDDQGH